MNLSTNRFSTIAGTFPLLSLNGDFADIVSYPPARYLGIIGIQLHKTHPEIIPQLMARLLAFLDAASTAGILSRQTVSRGSASRAHRAVNLQQTPLERDIMKTTRAKIEFARLPKDYASLYRLLTPRPIHDKVDFENVTGGFKWLAQVVEAGERCHGEFGRQGIFWGVS